MYRKVMKRFYLFAAIFLIVFLVYGYVETYRVKVTHMTVQEPGLVEVLHGKTIAHLSDLHMTALGYREKKVLDVLEYLKPDIIVLTGDYIGWSGNAGPALEFLAKLRAELGVYAVMGDYDYSVSRQSCLFCHKAGSGEKTRAHRVHMLKNKMETIGVNGGKLRILGLDEADRESDLSGIFSVLEAEKKPLIVLGHNPLQFDEIQKDIPLLMLAGDTHGGQLPLPSLVWRILGYEKNARYNKGLFLDGFKTMVVSRGIGTSHVPFRLFCPPEIVVYHF
jgi:predicted MPP superfamily phosphohydrolase